MSAQTDGERQSEANTLEPVPEAFEDETTATVDAEHLHVDARGNPEEIIKVQSPEVAVTRWWRPNCPTM